MTIKEVRYSLLKLKKLSGICFNKVPIKLPDTIGYDGKDISIQEAEKINPLIKNGYLNANTQCLVNLRLEDDDYLCEISFPIFMYCVINTDEDLFTMLDLFKYQLEELGEDTSKLEFTHVDE